MLGTAGVVCLVTEQGWDGALRGSVQSFVGGVELHFGEATAVAFGEAFSKFRA